MSLPVCRLSVFLQVVMLRSVGDLLRYIDENHLTSDFAANVEYCQSDWIVLRTVASRPAPAGVQEAQTARSHTAPFLFPGHRDLCGDGEGHCPGAAELWVRAL